jgi:1-pyrroline-5-carboxylate dehydrogenase
VLGREPRLRPESLWKRVRETLAAMLAEVRMGDVQDFRNFVGAVIDARSFAKLKAAIDGRAKTKDAQ